MARPIGSAEELERRRRLAVCRVTEDHYSAAEVGRMLGVDPRTVRGWVKAHELGGAEALNARTPPPRPSRLSAAQEQEMLTWLAHPATAQGFANELWTAPRVAALLERRFHVHYHPRYLNAFLKVRGITPQKPRSVPREKNPAAIARWKQTRWVEVKKKSATRRPIW